MKTTKGHPLLMGRKVFESLPSRLPNRAHFVVSRDESLQPRAKDLLESGKSVAMMNAESTVAWFSSFEEAIACLDQVLSPDDIVFGCGGGEGYLACWERADELDVTHIEHDYDGDVFFPVITPEDWKMVSESEPVLDIDRQRPTDPAVSLYFRRYVRHALM